jgi:hypothetical protein
MASEQAFSIAADFVAKVREIDSEFGRADIGPSAAMAEIRAALRALDRRLCRNKPDTYQQKGPTNGAT